MRCTLDGEWLLYGFPEGAYPAARPDDLLSLGIDPIPARVPGNVELDLLRADLIPEPFYAGNIRRLRTYESWEWWYTREFHGPEMQPGPRWHLVFAGLDTVATVWLNGVEVGQAENMLIEHRFDVTASLRPGVTNAVTVRLGSALNRARSHRYDALCMSSDRREESLFVRKAPHMWGWDIMPRAVSAGIWRSVWLEPQPATAIESLYFWTAAIQSSGALLGARFQFRTDAADPDGFALRFYGDCGDHTFEYEWPAEFLAGGCTIQVRDARLWWPKGYGDPRLYRVSTRLCWHGEVVAERSDCIGLRRVELRRTDRGPARLRSGQSVEGVRPWSVPPDPEGHFLFRVNDEPILIKGANWVPLDAFHSRDWERVDRAVALFDDLGCNMIRCWGGNVYEDQHFFDLCDERGILVWQDMAFACCRYPQTAAFLAQVQAEAEAVVLALRNHPSLTLWCGDNEVDTMYVEAGLDPQHNRLTREIIPQVVHRHDPFRPYLPSSPDIPSSLAGEAAPQEMVPEQHLWGPRGYFKSPYYADHRASFISEIGYHGCPNVSSIRHFIAPEHLWPWQDNEEWQAHSGYHWQHRAVDLDRVKLMANQIRELFGQIPEDLASFALGSQIAQAEALKYFIESTRLGKWRTSGILWWNVLDGWPQFSDAVVDYYFGRKLAYHYVRRSQRPVCLIIGEPGPGKYAPIVACNDSRAPVEIQYRVWLAGSTRALAEGVFTIPPNENWLVDRIRTYASEQCLYLMEWKAAAGGYGNHYVAIHPPISLDRYREWLTHIAALPEAFSAGDVAR